MKNIRLLFSALACITLGALGTAKAASDGLTDAPAGGTIKLQIERKEITKEQADAYRTSGDKISLGVYLVFSKEWEYNLLNVGVLIMQSQTAWAFYENESYCSTGGIQIPSQLNSLDPSHYLQNPADNIDICAAEGNNTHVPNNGCTLPLISMPDDWYINSFNWDDRGWPTFAWGTLIMQGNIDIKKQYAEKLDDGSYRIKLYDIQFRLKSTYNFRNLPVGFLDDILGHQNIDKSTSNCEINPAKGNVKYWPADAYNNGNPTGADWTDLKNTSYFQFIPGGLFIQTGPVVERFGPYFLS